MLIQIYSDFIILFSIYYVACTSISNEVSLMSILFNYIMQTPESHQINILCTQLCTNSK